MVDGSNSVKYRPNLTYSFKILLDLTLKVQKAQKQGNVLMFSQNCYQVKKLRAFLAFNVSKKYFIAVFVAKCFSRI